jgi:hypothetical protein
MTDMLRLDADYLQQQALAEAADARRTTDFCWKSWFNCIQPF